MAELITGMLSSSLSTATATVVADASRGGTVHRKYVYRGKNGKTKRNLRGDVDDMVSDAPGTCLQELGDLCLQCLDDDAEDRPNAFAVLGNLQRLSVQVVYGVAVPAAVVVDDKAKADIVVCCCSLCGRNDRGPTSGLSCGEHFICGDHLSTHSGVESGADPLECVVEGCDRCYSESDVQRCLPTAVYKQFVRRQVYNSEYFQTFAKMYAKAYSERIEGRIDVALDAIRYLGRKMDRALVAQAYLATGEKTPCPKLVWMVPQKRIAGAGLKGLKETFKDGFFQETAVYFVCEDTHLIGHEEPMIMNFGRKYVQHLLPLLRLSLVTLRVAGAIAAGLPFPIPNVDWPDRLKYFEGLFASVDDATMDKLADMERWVQDIADRGHSDQAPDRVARFKALVGGSYEMLSQKALKEEHSAKWRHSMTPRIAYGDVANDDDRMESSAAGDRMHCKIKWVTTVGI
jgi:hypothetical protein